ncbi:MAG: flagellar export chaperone FlgN [Clostridia bacterium]|nr:flagellar export chaperone FlgN [Clostridia bacterium]
MQDSIIRAKLTQIAEGYQEQLPLYEEMLRLSQEQERCLQAAEVDTDHLVALIGERQKLIERLEGLQGPLRKTRSEVTAALGLEEFAVSALTRKFPDPAANRLAEIMGQFLALLGRIKDLDKTNEETLRAQIKETATQLEQVRQEKKAKEAYEPKNPHKDGIFIDFSK